MIPRRVLCYAPYNRWELHGLWEMTILRAAKLRGADVRYVLCDGLYSDCDQFWEAFTGPRPADACLQCQAQVTRLVAGMGMDFRWLGRYLETSESRRAREWADGLADEELPGAVHGEWRIGEWMRGSVQSHFRSRELDAGDPRVARVLRSYAYSGLIACFALDRLIAESEPDVMLLFNGRQSSTRVALELARARGVRVVVHERGPRNESLLLVEDEDCLTLEPIRRHRREWSDVPLTQAELERVATLMAEREHGRNTGWVAFNAPPQPHAEVLAQLGLSGVRPIWVLFTSSDDEISSADYGSSFASQRDWIERTIEHARQNPQIDLVIRVHPNTGSRRSKGANRSQLEQMRQIRETLPPNARMIDPDTELSSYALMDLCTAGLSWVSTVGLELACKGKQVVVAAGCQTFGAPFVRSVEDEAGYEQILDELHSLPPRAVSAEIRRAALRHAYGWFFRLRVDFPLVQMPTPHDGVLAYSSEEALLPGRDEGLDRCVRILLDGEPVCPPPGPAELARTTADEDAFLAGFGRRHVTVLAFADELIEDVELLRCWREACDGRDDVTLLIQTPPQDVPRLVDAVAQVGLDRDDGPELVASEVDEQMLASVSAVFSRAEHSELAGEKPRYDPDSLPRLLRG